MLTADENIVDVQFSVQYKVKDPVAWVFNNRDQVETVRDSAETAMRELVGRSKMDALLFESRDKLAGDAQRMIQQMADRYKLGAEITGVTMQSLQPPRAGAAAFEETVKAQEDRARARAEAQAYADDILPQAKGKAARLLEDAEAYRATTETPRPATPPASTRSWPSTRKRRPSRATACTSTPCSRSSPAPARS
jgi:membrane protease subunit HflK